MEEENALLRERVVETERSNEELAKKLDETTRNSLLVEQQLTNAINVFKHQLAYQGNKIRQLTEEVRERSVTVAQLMSQLRFGSNHDTVSGSDRPRCRLHSHPNTHWDSMFVPHSVERCTSSADGDSRCSLVRSVSVTYPGGRPNVVAHKCKHSSANPRPQHLPCLYSRWQSFSSGGCNIEKPPRKFSYTPVERMSLTRSLHESDKSSKSNAESTTNN
ncbi:unnamed protein product [Toxocara canis]|uniref:Uncharacterized protein n=1 Tax=Toxocara canis TaxID=6265 RepID=A0A3P7ISG2_TOXCA|nr:unnamed protein product [Toxocara canis]